MSKFTVPTRDQVSNNNKVIFDNLQKSLGFVPNLYATFAISETALGDYLSFQNRKSSFTAKEKEIINLVVSEVNSCRYCLAAHTHVCKILGFTDNQIMEIRSGGASFDQKLDALIKLVESTVINRGKPDIGLVEYFLNSGYTETHIIDMVMAIGDKIISNYLHGITQIPIDFSITPESPREVLDNNKVPMVQAQVADSPVNLKPLLIGAKFPEASLQSLDSNFVNIHERLKVKPTVIIFYRGGWCPYCNMHLSDIANVEKEILQMNYQIIAISPDQPQDLQITQDKENIHYQLLSDSNGELCKKMGIAYKTPEHYKKNITEGPFQINDEFIPLPSLYVINTDGIILFNYINLDITHRIKGKMLLSVLQNLDLK